MKTCQNIMAATPTDKIVPKESRHPCAIFKLNAISNKNKNSNIMEPANPHSSADTEKIKSVCCSGRNDNFFQLGGHSLKAIRLLARINNKFNINLPLMTIFQYPALANLSARVSRQKKIKHKKISKTNKQIIFLNLYVQRS